MTQPPPVLAETCKNFLRQGRGALAQGELVLASRAGWQAAVYATAEYAGPGTDFTDAARRLVKDNLGNANAAEWVVSAMALSDNIEYGWLDRDGITRRLDDVQRLVMLVKDISSPPQTAGDILGQAWECMDNGSLVPACEKGWEAATHAAKTYAKAMGHDHIRSNYLSQVTRYLKQEPGGSEAGNWSMSAKMLLESFHAKADRLDAELIGNDLDDVGKLVALVNATAKKPR